MATLRYFVVLLLILLLATLSGWWLAEIRKLPIKPDADAATRYDYFFKDFESTVMSSQGQPTYRVHADYLEHYPLDNRVMMKQPRFTLYQEGNTWNARAENAEVYVDDKLMLLTGNVVFKQAARKDQAEVTLFSEHLQIDAAQQTAETPTQVKILSGKDTIRAKGMKVNLAQGHMELLSDVQGQYHLPPRR